MGGRMLDEDFTPCATCGWPLTDAVVHTRPDGTKVLVHPLCARRPIRRRSPAAGPSDDREVGGR